MTAGYAGGDVRLRDLLITPEDASPRWGLVALLAANAAVAAGVLLSVLDLREVLLTFWAETGVIGGWALYRILRLGGLVMIPLVGFFLVHFGGFMFVHLVFLGSLTRADFSQAEWEGSSFTIDADASGMNDGFGATIANALADVPLWAVALLVVAHGIESARIERRARQRQEAALREAEAKGDLDPTPPDGRSTAVGKLSAYMARRAVMNDPKRGGPTSPMGGVYARVFVMQITIVGGAFVAAALGTPVWIVVVLIAAKTVVDLAVFAGKSSSRVTT